jgi:hypothetical protein
MEKMSEKWKPEAGELYYYFDHEFDILSDLHINARRDEKLTDIGNCFRTKAEAESAAEKVKALLLNLHADAKVNTQDAPLPKLTTEVFNRPDCPEWAKWAAVDYSGIAFFYENKPIFTGTCYQSIIGETKIIDSSIKWDAKYCQNILIERPIVLPDWCKVGEWCYCLDDDGYGKYFKITKIKDNFIYGEDWDIDYHFVRQARLRPYSADEMKALVGKVIKDTYGNISFITGYCVNKEVVYSGTTNFTAECLLRLCCFLDNSPCGVLEHLENGEWVE